MRLPQNVLETSGSAAQGLASLGWIALAIFSATTLAVWLLIAWLVLRRRGTLEEHEPVDAGGGQAWILAGGFVIPLLVLTFLFALTLKTMRAYPMSAEAGAPQLRVVGYQWWFDAEYLDQGPDHLLHAPTEIHIPVGRPVDIELVTRDVIHSFWVPQLHGKVDLVPGQANHIRLRADRPGVYSGQCAEFCGVQHANMRISVVAEAPEKYRAWLDAQRAAARVATAPEAARGRQVFERAACPLCHTVRGTPAHGQVGPDLTHVGSRASIAGGMLANNTANLEAWVTHAQSLKPGAQMPDLSQFRGEELRALVAYLQSLK